MVTRGEVVTAKRLLGQASEQGRDAGILHLEASLWQLVRTGQGQPQQEGQGLPWLSCMPPEGHIPPRPCSNN